MSKKFELGITTFAEVMTDPVTGYKPSYDERLQQLVDEIVLADQVGLDYFGVGEHHREDFAVSAPHMVLAAAAPLTKHIKLSSAVTVLSSDDPVRVYQNFATLNALSKGRAEIMAGRGSFIESYPLFGYQLNDYEQLFDEKLRLLKDIRDNEIVNFDGKMRPKIKNLGIYPRTSFPLSIHVAVGGTPQSVVRAAKLELPLFLAIIGGSPLNFKPFVQLYHQRWQQFGHQPDAAMISVHSHGYIAEDFEQAVEDYYPSMSVVMNKLGKERGWSPYTRATYDAMVSMQGALYVGDPQYVAEKILYLRKQLGIQRFALHIPAGPLAHDKVMQTIRLLGEKVKPIIDQAIKDEE